MLRHSLAALAASLLLLGALGVQAAPAIVDGTSNTIQFPEIPPAPEPPIDPCELDPRGCDEPPVAEPPVAEPPAPTFSKELAGSARLAGNGFKAIQPYTLQVSFDTAELTLLAMDADGTLYSGRLVPKGATGTRFKLFLDDPSGDALAAEVAARAAAAAGLPAGGVLGGSSKLTLKLNQDGSASLKIKSEVLVDGMGEVVFKANLSSAASN